MRNLLQSRFLIYILFFPYPSFPPRFNFTTSSVLEYCKNNAIIQIFNSYQVVSKTQITCLNSTFKMFLSVC